MNILCLILYHNYEIRPHTPMPMSKLEKATLAAGELPSLKYKDVEVAHYNMKFSYCTRCGKKET